VNGTASAPSARAVKRCCALVYGQGWLPLLLGPAYHPGGRELTIALAHRLDLAPGQRVLDVGSGPGSSARLLARRFGVTVLGVDLAEAAVRGAAATPGPEGGAGRVGFVVGDAERLPVGEESVDAVLCECALSTFPDKVAALRGFRRVLRPRGRVGISDVVLDPERLDPALRSLAGRVACLADALPLEGYRRLLGEAGFRVLHVEERADALALLIERIRAAIDVLAMASPPGIGPSDLDRARDLAARAAEAVGRDVAGYALLTAEPA
jgi:arsenite methyltransferase